MFSECVFCVKGDRIEVNGREFMLGKMSASCLNITPKEFEDIYALYESAEQILDKEYNDKSAQWAMDSFREWNDNEFDVDNTPDDFELEYIPPSKDEWQNLNDTLSKICNMLLKHEIFQVLADPHYINYFEQFKVITDDMLTAEIWERYSMSAYALKPIIDDIYNFNKTIYYFITGGIMRLKKCDPENYAAAYYDFINSPNAYKMIVNPLSEPFMSYDLIARLTKSCQRKVITESERRVLLRKAEKLYHTAMTSPEFTNEEFEQQLSSANLYKLCGVTPPKKGRPNKENNE